MIHKGSKQLIQTQALKLNCSKNFLSIPPFIKSTTVKQLSASMLTYNTFFSSNSSLKAYISCYDFKLLIFKIVKCFFSEILELGTIYSISFFYQFCKKQHFKGRYLGTQNIFQCTYYMFQMQNFIWENVLHLKLVSYRRIFIDVFLITHLLCI